MYNYTTVDKSNSCIIKTIRFHCTEPADTNYSCYFSFYTFIMKIRFFFRYGKSMFSPFLWIIVLWITHQITVNLVFYDHLDHNEMQSIQVQHACKIDKTFIIFNLIKLKECYLST